MLSIPDNAALKQVEEAGMVSMTPIWHGMDFTSRLGALRRAYEISYATIRQQSDEKQTEVTDHYNRIQYGGEEDELVTVAGATIKRSVLLSVELRSINSAEVALQKSFIISLYHFWERSVQRWVPFKSTKRKNPNHGDLVVMSIKAGVSGDLQALEPWHFINNALKHDNDDWIKKLEQNGFSKYIGYYHDDDSGPLNPKLKPYERIMLTHQNMIEFFDLVQTLGPDVMNGWPDILDAYVEWEPV